MRRTELVGISACAVLAVAAASNVARGDDEAATHDWRPFGEAHWQIASLAVEDSTVTDDREGTRGDCPVGMVDVRGQMKTGTVAETIESMQNASCLDWQQRSFPSRCLRFDMASLESIMRELRATPMQFCIDRFEYPNLRGAYPVVAVTWHEARALCAEAGKRLCSEDEWTFACEGPEALPYPYGYERDPSACVIDRPNPAFDERALTRRRSAAFAPELDRLWRGERSGDRPRCRSPFGVYDMTGNIDEWTTSTRPGGYRSILKGGYWGRFELAVVRRRAPTGRPSSSINKASGAARTRPRAVGEEAAARALDSKDLIDGVRFSPDVLAGRDVRRNEP